MKMGTPSNGTPYDNVAPQRRADVQKDSDKHSIG
jgi:hypothetical protein